MRVGRAAAVPRAAEAAGAAAEIDGAGQRMTRLSLGFTRVGWGGRLQPALGRLKAAPTSVNASELRSGRVVVTALICAALVVLASCSRAPARPEYRTFEAPEDAVRALHEAVSKGSIDDVIAIFGPEGKELIDSSDPAIARSNREVFSIAFGEQWHLVDDGPGKTLVVGNEEWPFPVPLVREEAGGWRFDTAAGKEEIVARRIGRNELAAIRISRAYVAAQRLYAQQGHDGKRAGLYAKAFRSDPGRQNGLYWPAARGQRRSPLGELIADAAQERAPSEPERVPPSPFHGYHFKILTAQGAAASGGAKDYLVKDEMSGGFALAAWPAQYDATGIMTFVVNQDGVVYEKDLGPGTDAAARTISLYDPDPSWTIAQ